ncbi:amylo-alpha-1,6-glucosidase [Capsulimonas corticalis]|nr:hypothetical protein [Capsulimonas corticalis]
MIATEESSSQTTGEISAYPNIDIGSIPFSCRGSFLTISLDQTFGRHRLRVQTIRKSAISHKWQAGDDWSHDLLEIAMIVNSVEEPYRTAATADKIQLTALATPMPEVPDHNSFTASSPADHASAVVLFADPETLLIQFSHCDVRLVPPRKLTGVGWITAPSPDRLRWYDGRSLYYFDVSVEDGSATYIPTAQATEGDSADFITLSGAQDSVVATLRVRLNEELAEDSAPEFQKIAAARKDELDDWMAMTPPAPDKYAEAARVAWYLFWNLQVAPSGEYTRQTILPSKRALSQIWSWDNCFNALAAVSSDHRLAWDQLLAILDHQSDTGLLPDSVNDLRANFGFNKPPVWGWTTHRLLKSTPPDRRAFYAGEVYSKIAKFHQWWFRCRDLTQTGLPFYMHGNDSGWDNASIFDEGWPVASPDLLAYLILQAEGLSEMAGLLGRSKEASEWEQQSISLLQLFQTRFVRDDALIFYVLRPEGLVSRTSTSLLTRIPIVLGNRLAPPVLNRLIREITSEELFLAPFGPATEALNSAKYQSNGYWRGPVWGPSTFLVFDSLLQCNETTAAEEIAERFCAACNIQRDFRENYDAVTGAGQYDSGMTWSAADFLLMANWLATKSSAAVGEKEA